MTARDDNARRMAGEVLEPFQGRPMNDSDLPRDGLWKHLPRARHPDFAEAAEPSPLPEFPTQHLPPFARDFCAEYASFGETSVCTIGTYVLGAMASSLGGKFEICLRPGAPGARGYYQPLNLMTLVVDDSGGRKSDACRAAFRPAFAYQDELVDMWRAEQPKAKARAEAAKAALAKAAARLKNDPGDHNAQRAYEEAERKAGLSRPPIMPKLLTDNVTPERLAGLLDEQGGRMTIATEEAGFLANALGRYNSNGESALDVYLQAYSRQPVQVDRKGEGATIYVRNPVLTIAAGLQPGAFRQANGRAEFRDRGMLARMLISVPRSLAGHRTNRTAPMALATTEGYARSMRSMLLYPPSGPNADAPFVALSAGAAAAHQDLFEEVDPLQREGGELAHMRDWMAKFPSAVGRIAGILHFAAAAARGELDLAYERPVSEATMRGAIALGRYYLAHARHVYEVLLAPEGASTERDRRASALVTLAWLYPAGREFTVSAPIEALWPAPKAAPPPDAAYAREALAAFSGGRGDTRPTRDALGYALRASAGKVAGGYRLERRGKGTNNVRKWAVVPAVATITPITPITPENHPAQGSSPASPPPSPLRREAEYGHETRLRGHGGDGGHLPGERPL